MTESAATCLLSQIAQSPLGQLEFDEERLDLLLGVKTVKLDT